MGLEDELRAGVIVCCIAGCEARAIKVRYLCFDHYMKLRAPHRRLVTFLYREGAIRDGFEEAFENVMQQNALRLARKAEAAAPLDEGLALGQRRPGAPQVTIRRKRSFVPR